MKKLLTAILILCIAFTLSAPALADIGQGESIQTRFAKLRQELAEEAKNSANECMDKIIKAQDEQKLVAEHLHKARELQYEAKDTGKATEMPEAMKSFMDAGGLAYSNAGGDSMLTAEEWDTAIQSLQEYMEQIGMEIQQIMVYVQDFTGLYNSYTQGGNSAIGDSSGRLAGLARGQSLFSTEGGLVTTAPVAISLVVGVALGMLIMWLILRKKAKDAAQ